MTFAKNKMTRFEKILVALIIAWIAQAISLPVIHFAMKSAILERSSKSGDYAANVISLYSNLAGFTGFLAKAVFGYWLYIASRNENEKKWIWCLLGVFGGIYGVLIFYPYLILKEIRSKKAPTHAPETICTVTERTAP